MTIEKVITGGTAEIFHVNKNEFIKVVDVSGKQVADLIAFKRDEFSEYLSTAHTRPINGKIYVAQGDCLYSNYRSPLLEIVEDTVGVHDTMIPCCDTARYEKDFGVKGHRSCRGNFVEAFADYNLPYSQVPDPVNLFQNSPLNSDGTFADIEEPKTKSGDYVLLKALTDLIIGISACPMDLLPTNGWKITDIGVTIIKKSEK